MANRLPKGITQRGSKFRVSIMVAGARLTATCDTLVDAIQRADAMRLGVDTGQVEKAAPWTLEEACEALMAERVKVNYTSQESVTRVGTRSRRSPFWGTIRRPVRWAAPYSRVCFPSAMVCCGAKRASAWWPRRRSST